jgi:hypothetical protein
MRRKVKTTLFVTAPLAIGAVLLLYLGFDNGNKTADQPVKETSVGNIKGKANGFSVDCETELVVESGNHDTFYSKDVLTSVEDNNDGEVERIILTRKNRALQIDITRDGYFSIALGDETENLYTADESIFMPVQPGGVPRGVFIKVRSKSDGEILTARVSSTGWYTPLFYSSGVVVHSPEAFKSIPKGANSGEIQIKNMLTILDRKIGHMPDPKELEIKLMFDPKVMTMVDGQQRRVLPKDLVIETDWLGGTILIDHNE